MEAKKPPFPGTAEECKLDPGPDHPPDLSSVPEPDPDNPLDPEERPSNPLPDALLLPAELVTPQKELPLLHVRGRVLVVERVITRLAPRLPPLRVRRVQVLVIERITHLAPREYRAHTPRHSRHIQRERERGVFGKSILRVFERTFDFYSRNI